MLTILFLIRSFQDAGIIKKHGKNDWQEDWYGTSLQVVIWVLADLMLATLLGVIIAGIKYSL